MQQPDSTEPLAKKLKTDSSNEKVIVAPSKKNGLIPEKKNKPTQVIENGLNLNRIKVGSRKSQLALFQTNFVVEQLRKIYPHTVYDIIAMSTMGDHILNMPLSKIGEKSLFTKELEVALEKGEAHIIVHSLKDLPTSLPPGMVIGAICRRENPFDVVAFSPEHDCKELDQLPEESVIGTSSLRRVAQLKRSYPNLKFLSIRGNLNTRLRKLDEDKTYSALILAAAGLIRLDLSHRISKILSPDECMYAVGQGAIGIECRANDLPTIRLLSKIADKETTLCCIAERAFMRTLEGGCSVPVAVNTTLKDNKITLKGGVFSLDGSESLVEKLTIDLKCNNNFKMEAIHQEHFCGVVAPHLPQELLKSVERLGVDLASSLLEKGAGEILKKAREQNAMT